MIPRSFLEQLNLRLDIEDVISSYLPLKRAGRNARGLCPFHSEKTPSFTVYPDTQSYYCFGCGAGGDVVSFVMRAENLGYPEAVRLLARRAGLEVPEDGGDEAAELKSRILQINREAALFFHKCLKSPAGKPGYDYLKNRGLSDHTITSYGLGFAPDSWGSLVDYFKHKGYSEQELFAAAVAAKGRSGSAYDQFRNRVIFPIIDLRGGVVGFGGRVLDNSKPKYLNSADTPVFKKSRNLFSLNFAKNAVKDRLILAEGYMDVISIYAAGFPYVVATLGTSLTEEQARLMSKYAKEVVIAYDSDSAGQTATHRAVNLLSQVGVATKVVQMEGAKDPDEYIKKFGATRFGLLLDAASDVISHELGALRARCDLDHSAGRVEYVRGAVNVLAEIQNPLEREVYAAQVARETGVMPESVVSQTNELLKKKLRRKEKREWRDIEVGKGAFLDKINPDKALFPREARAEEGILAFLFKNPDCYQELTARLTSGDFVTAFNRRVLEIMLTMAAEGEEVTISALGLRLSPEELRGVAGIAARTAETRITKEMFGDYIDTLLAHKDRLSPARAKEISPEEGEQYRQKLNRQKK